MSYYGKMECLTFEIKVEQDHINFGRTEENLNQCTDDVFNGFFENDVKRNDLQLKKWKKIKSFECYMCPTRTYKRILGLQRHMKNDHKFDISITYNNETKKTCHICNITYTDRSNLYRHNKKVHLGIITENKRTDTPCEFCGKCFSTLNNKERHVRNVHNGEKPFVCTLCGMAFSQSNNLHTHQFRKHNAEKKFKCDECPKSYLEKRFLTRHKETNHNTSNGEHPNRRKKKYESQKDKEKSNNVYNKNRIFCEICGKSINASGILGHRLMHEGKKPYECTVCSKSFRTMQCLKLHTVVHTRIRKHKCHLCDKSFLSRSNLREHLKRHTGEKPFKCSYCSKQFFIRFNLELHQRVHTGEKPFSCNMCPSKFSNASTLRKHAINIHQTAEAAIQQIDNKKANS